MLRPLGAKQDGTTGAARRTIGRRGPVPVRTAWLVAAAVTLLLGGAEPGWAQDGLVAEAMPEGNLVAIGAGAYPDYIGSDDYSLGAIPLVRYQYWGKRDLTLIGNTLNVNLLDAGGWRLGPSGILRFGRSDVRDDVVRRVHEIDMSVDLGVFAGYTWVHPAESRKRVGVSGWGLADVTDSHGGWTAGANVFGTYPVLRGLTLAGGMGATYGSGAYMSAYFGVTSADAQASGLPAYQAEAGLRDVRGWLVALVHLSPSWTLGAGVIYSRLAGEPAGSPIVSERGSRDQWVYGAGAMFLW